MQLFIKKLFGSGFTTLIISNEEINDIMKRVNSLEESGLLVKGFSEIKNEAKEQKGRFLGMLLGTLGTSWSGHLLRGKGAIAMIKGLEGNMPGHGTIRPGEGTITAGEGRIRAGQDF